MRNFMHQINIHLMRINYKEDLMKIFLCHQIELFSKKNHNVGWKKNLQIDETNIGTLPFSLIKPAPFRACHVIFLWKIYCFYFLLCFVCASFFFVFFILYSIFFFFWFFEKILQWNVILHDILFFRSFPLYYFR